MLKVGFMQTVHSCDARKVEIVNGSLVVAAGS